MTLNKYSFKHILILPALYLIYTLFLSIFAKPYLNSIDTMGNNLLLMLSIPGHVILSGYVFLTVGSKSLFIKDELKMIYRWKDLIPGILLGILTLIVSMALSIFLPQVKSAAPEFVFKGFNIVLLFYILFVSFLAPLVEELVFRGFLWKILEEKGIHRVLILFITSLLFAIIHMDLNNLPILFVGGMIYGLLRMKTGHVSRSVVAHITNNIIVSIMMFIVPLIL